MRLTLVPPSDPSSYPFVHGIRPRFCETDAMGIIHHAAYLPYLEEARVAYLRHLGHPYDQVRAGGVDFAVLEVLVRYRLPVRFDEDLQVSLVVGDRTRTSFQMAYLLTVDGAVRASAVTVHGAVDARGRPRRLPEWVSTLDPGASPTAR